MEDLTSWTEMLKAVGPWGTMAIAMGLFLWRVLKWLKPIGERVAEKHMKLVDTLTENLPQNLSSHAITHSKLDQAQARLDQIRDKIASR